MFKAIIMVKAGSWDEVLVDYQDKCQINYIGTDSQSNETIATLRTNDADYYEKLKNDTRLYLEDSQPLQMTTETITVMDNF